jgi:hypothetical protein
MSAGSRLDVARGLVEFTDMSSRSFFALAGLTCLVAACGDDGATTGSGGSPTGQGGGATTASGGAGQGGAGQGGGTTTTTGGGCVRPAGPADKDRFVVVGHPYDLPANVGSYEVLALSQTGVLSKTGNHFTMGEVADRELAFTPDGALGFAAQDDGSVGVFTLDAAGTPTVLEASFTGAFYADAVRVSDDGSTLFIVDVNFPENGGGIYSAPIDCNGALGTPTRLFETKSARAFVPVSAGSALTVARGALGSTTVAHADLVDLAGPSLVSSVDAFGDDDAILASFALTHDAKHLLIGDNSAFSAVPNRVAVVGVGANALTAVDVLPDIEDPYSLAASPFDDAAIVASGFGDAIFVLKYDGAAATPFTLDGELAYASSGPQLPGALAMLSRGGLSGRVFIAEVRGVYQVEFAGSGNVVDHDVFDLGGGNENIVAGMGVQP